MPFSKVVLIIVTLIVLDYAQVAANEDLQVSESKGKKFPRHIQSNVRPKTQRRRPFLRNGPARGRSDSSEDGGEEHDAPGYVIISYGGRIGKKDNGQRYGNKYGSDYSVEYVGNLYGYEEGHGYFSGYNSGHNEYSSGYTDVTHSQQGTSDGGGSDENDGTKGNAEIMSGVSVMNGDSSSDGMKDMGGSMGGQMNTGEDVGAVKDTKGTADSAGEATLPAGGNIDSDGTVTIDGSAMDDAPVAGGDATRIEASKGKDEVMVDSVVTGGDATVSTDGTEAIGGETVGIEGSKGMEAMDEMAIPVDGEAPGTVVATGTVGTMDELMALLDGIGGSEGSTGTIKSMDDLMAIIGGAEGVEGLGDITGLTDDTAGTDGSIGNSGSIGSPVDSSTTGADANEEGSHSGGIGSFEEGTYSSSTEDEYTVSFDFVTEDEAIELGAITKNADAQNPSGDGHAAGDDFSIAFLTADTAKPSESGTEVASEIITETGKIKMMSEPAEMVKAEALTAMEETGKMVAEPAEMMNTGGKESIDTGSAPSPGPEKSIAPMSVPEITANNLRRMGRNQQGSWIPVNNYRNGDRRLIPAGRVNHPGNRARPQNRAISSLPIENHKHGNLPGNGEKVRSTGSKTGPGPVRNAPMKQEKPGGMSGNGASKFRSIGEGTSANRGMKETGPMGSISVREIQSGPGKIKPMSGNIDMVHGGSGSMKAVNVAPITEHSKNSPSGNPSGNTGSGKKRFLSMGKGRNTSGNGGKLESGSASSKSVKTQSGNEEKVKGNGDKLSSFIGKGSTRPARPAQLMSPPPSKEMMRPNPMKGETASENKEISEDTSERPPGKGKGGKASKNGVKEKRQISASSSSSSSEKGKKGSEKGKETETSESAVKSASGGGDKVEKVNGEEVKQNSGFVRNGPLNIVRYLRKGIGRYL
ncbi:mucin-19-like isoform X2 [Daphnia carinata]|uniref:mucin-19-like isoform X2 n=1 Tax=Daphnia carinata TaxID=120202 RepID=UPI00257B0AAC|nr:mucin-19-like isoform X2 [Daphnia carinata]